MKCNIMYKYNFGNNQKEMIVECDDYQLQSKEKIITFIKNTGENVFVKTSISILIVNFDTVESIEIIEE